MRPGEEDGVHYYFLSEQEFVEMQAESAFIETAQVFGNWYGTSKSAIEHAIVRGDDIILEIDWQGAEQVRRLFPKESVSIFILPPSKEALRRRLEHRAQDHSHVITKRMDAAKNEISHFSEFDYLIVNDQFDIALADFKAIVRAHRLVAQKQFERHSVLLQELLAQT
jgi:guanylate kinase